MTGSNRKGSPHDLHFKSELSLERLRPRLDDFWNSINVDDTSKRRFHQRLDEHWHALFALFYELYGTRYDYFYHLEQLLLIAARAFELHTCPEQAFAAYHDTIREQLGIPEKRMIICGLALGVPDFGNPANALKTERLALTEFVRFHS